MTAREMSVAIGQKVWFVVNEMRFLCVVEDVKTSYGQPRFKIRPVNGYGNQWVEINGGKIEPFKTPSKELTNY